VLSLKGFRKNFFNDLLEIHWKHWTTLGVASYIQPEKYWIVDLEALIVSTLTIGLLDKRLLSSSLEWLMKNGQWINLSRLKRISEFFKKPFPGAQEPLIVPEIFELLIDKYNKYAQTDMVR